MPLRDDPGFRLALAKLPGLGCGLASQPDDERMGKRADDARLVRMMRTMIDILLCQLVPNQPRRVTLDIR